MGCSLLHAVVNAASPERTPAAIAGAANPPHARSFAELYAARKAAYLRGTTSFVSLEVT